MVKGDVMVKGGRILLFSSKESMKIMKRSIAIGLDGTLCYLLEMTFPRGDFSQNDFLQRWLFTEMTLPRGTHETSLDEPDVLKV